MKHAFLALGFWWVLTAAGTAATYDPDYIQGATILSAPTGNTVLGFTAPKIVGDAQGVKAEGPTGIGSRDMTQTNGSGSNSYTGYRIENGLAFPFDVVIDLKANYALSEIWIWNFFQNIYVNDSGFKDVDIYYWANGQSPKLAGSYVLRQETVVNASAPAGNLAAGGDPAGHVAGDPITFATEKYARYIKLHVKSNYGNSDWRGLNKIRFYKSSDPVTTGGLKGLPSTITFTTGSVNVHYTKSLVLTNLNDATSTDSAITIDSINTSGIAAPFSLIQQPASYPYTLTGGQSTTLVFQFHPTATGSFTGGSVTVTYTTAAGNTYAAQATISSAGAIVGLNAAGKWELYE